MLADATWLNEDLEIRRTNNAVSPVPVSQMRVSAGGKWDSVFK